MTVAVSTMHAAGEWPASLSRLVRCFDFEEFAKLAERAGGDVEEEVERYVESLSQRQRHELHGVRDRLAVLADSTLGDRLTPGSGPEIDLARTLRDGGVAYFQLDSDRFPLLSQMVAASLVIDLVTLTGSLQGGQQRGLVLIDEFAAVAAAEISRVLGRSRSAGISVVLATQTLADLDAASGSIALRRQVLSHVEFVVAHRQPEPDAAETLALDRRDNSELVGDPAGWRGALGQQVRGEGTRTREREFIRHPDEFKRLGVGEAIVIEPARPPGAQLVSIWRPNAESAVGQRPTHRRRLIRTGSAVRRRRFPR